METHEKFHRLNSLIGCDAGEGPDVDAWRKARSAHLYRQSQILARSAIDLHRSTLAGWVGEAAFHLGPVVDRLAEHLKRSTKLFMDETTAPVLDPGRGRTRTGFLWALARDDRGWGGADPPGVVYFYAPGRGGEHAETFPEGFDGILQIDGYPGYNRLTRRARNPPDLVLREPEVVPGYPDRLLPVDEAAAKELKKRTLANLYNARPAWLDHAHRALDEAVADAYGWGDDFRAGRLTDDEILARLFALNQERAARQP